MSRTLSLLTCLALAACARGLTVRVDPAGGAPRIVVDGKPVRARMFWGGPGSSPLAIGPAWQAMSFEFIASGNATNGTMHFRFGQKPGDIFLDDIHVVDTDAGADLVPNCDFEGGLESFRHDWTHWPTGVANTVGTITVEPGVGAHGSAGLHVHLIAPPAGSGWPDFHIYHIPNLHLVEGHHYTVTFQVRADAARDLTVAFYRPGNFFTHLGGPADAFDTQIKLAAAAGIDFVSYPMGTPWPKPGEAPDWTGVDSMCERVLRANPHALLLPRVGAEPPDWWRVAHPDLMMRYENGAKGPNAVPCSELYRRDCAAALAALVAHCEEKFGDHIAGYHVCGQNTGEWFYDQTWGPLLNGYAPGDRDGWRAWLAAHYANDAALQAAWHQPAATLAAAEAPSAERRHAAPHGILRDPSGEQDLIDWARFQQEAMADCVCALAKSVRTASNGRKLSVFFFGYLFEFGNVWNGPAVCGHYALRRVIDSPDIDILCSPISYNDRGLGQSAQSMTAAESVELGGKLWLNEDDTHTYLATGDPPGSRDHVTTLADTNRELTRNVAEEALRNFGTWWMDLGSSGWFNDKGMWDRMKQLAALDDPLLATPTPFRPQVAAVIDPASMIRVAPHGPQVTGPGVVDARRDLGRMGAPFGAYLQDDVLAGKVAARLYVFLTTWRLSAAERARLRAVTRGATRVWCYAPGAYDQDKLSLAAMGELTGFALAPSNAQQAWVTPTARGRALGLTKEWGAKAAIRPLFAVTDAQPDEILATYPDGGVAVALRKLDDGPSLFVGAPGFTPELMRLAAKTAGVHLFADQDCNVYANGPFVAFHAAADGPLTIDTGRRGPVTDVLTGERLGFGPTLAFTVTRGETRVLRY